MKLILKLVLLYRRGRGFVKGGGGGLCRGRAGGGAPGPPPPPRGGRGFVGGGSARAAGGGGGRGGPRAGGRRRRPGRRPCVPPPTNRPAARCPRAAESPRPGRGLHRRGRGCEKNGVRTGWGRPRRGPAHQGTTAHWRQWHRRRHCGAPPLPCDRCRAAGRHRRQPQCR